MSIEIKSLKEQWVAYPAIEQVWNSAFPAEFPLTEKLWVQNTVKDPDFDNSQLLIARLPESECAGFILLKRHYRPTPGLENYHQEGFIATLAVAPEFQRRGIAKVLLEAAENKLRAEGVTKINLGSNLRHFFPGLPVQCSAAQSFFEQAGYAFDATKPQVDLDGALLPELFEPALAKVQGLQYRQGKTSSTDNVDWIVFLEEAFPGRWLYEAQLYLEQAGALEEVTFAVDNAGKIVGFLFTSTSESTLIQPGKYWLQSATEWGSIGPLGLHPAIRGGGGGLGLVAAAMRYLAERGLKYARIDWTDLVSFYGKLGFKPALQYIPGSKTLSS